MEPLDLKPYSVVGDKNFTDDSLIRISRKQFNDTLLKKTGPTFIFTNCIFKNLEIDNIETIEIEEIKIIFLNCFIEEINIVTIETKNITTERLKK